MKTGDKNLGVPDYFIVLKLLENNGRKTIREVFKESGITVAHIYNIRKAFENKSQERRVIAFHSRPV